MIAAEELTDDMHSWTGSQIAFGAMMICAAEAAVFGAAGLVLWGLGKCLAKLLRKTQRPKYYPQERMRRQALAKERRRIKKRFTLNKAPTPEELIEQWKRIRKSPKDMIIFGSMLCDLEAYVDNSLVRDEYGEIIGRNPGIRGWLAENCQQLSAKYKTVMRYKAMAEKFRQAIGLEDPYPAAMVIEENENTVRKDQIAGMIVEKKEAAGRLLKSCGVTQRSLIAVIDAQIDPAAVPLEIEIQERRRQGLPDKDGIVDKFVQMMA